MAEVLDVLVQEDDISNKVFYAARASEGDDQEVICGVCSEESGGVAEVAGAGCFSSVCLFGLGLTLDSGVVVYLEN